ncbi:hypothetical protein [Methylobacterium sp. 77]|uniref:hypothetical protein n=1 Tax=Methylobacterium sp. 77 TaxID=1101192 RepID=UPI000377DEC4|nr:hypothetical protein [Methylobacterium sp. 77]
MSLSPYLQRLGIVLIAAALVMGPIADPMPVLIAYGTAGLLLATCSIVDLMSCRSSSSMDNAAAARRAIRSGARRTV